MCWGRGRRTARVGNCRGRTGRWAQVRTGRWEQRQQVWVLGPGPHMRGIRGADQVRRGPFLLETLWGCSEPHLESMGAPLWVLPRPMGRLPSDPPLLGSQQLACLGPGERSKNRFQDGLKSVGKLASRWGQLLPTRVNYFEPGRSYFKVWTEVRSRPRRAVSKYPAYPGRAGQAEPSPQEQGAWPQEWLGPEGQQGWWTRSVAMWLVLSHRGPLESPALLWLLGGPCSPSQSPGWLCFSPGGHL